MSEDIKYYYDILNSKWWYFDTETGEWKEYEEGSNEETSENNNKYNDNKLETTREYSDSQNLISQNEDENNEYIEYNNVSNPKSLDPNTSNTVNNNNEHLKETTESQRELDSLTYPNDSPNIYSGVTDSKNDNKVYSLNQNLKNYNFEDKLDDDELLNKNYEDSYIENNDVSNYINNYVDNDIANNDLNANENYYENSVANNETYYENNNEYNYDTVYNNEDKIEPDAYENYKNSDYYNYEDGENDNSYEYNKNKNDLFSNENLNENKREFVGISPYYPQENRYYSGNVKQNENNDHELLKNKSFDNTNLIHNGVSNNVENVKKENACYPNAPNELSEKINNLLTRSTSNSSYSKVDSSSLIEKLFSRSFTRSDHLNSFNTVGKDSEEENNEDIEDNKNDDEMTKKKTKVNFQFLEENENKNDDNDKEKNNNEDNKELFEIENDTKVIPFVRRATRKLTFKNQGGLSGCLKVFQEKKKELLSSSTNEVNDMEIKMANLKRRARELARRYKTKNQSDQSEKNNQMKTKFEELVLQVQKHKKELQEKDNNSGALNVSNNISVSNNDLNSSVTPEN